MKSKIREAQNELTEGRVCNAFLDLLSEKDLGKITVRDVCERAIISRGTFYLHFRDINDLLESINSWYISRAMPYYQMEFDSFGVVNDEEKFREGVTGHLQILASWPKYAVTIFGRNLCPWVFDEIMSICRDKMRARLAELGGPVDAEKSEYEFVYGASGVHPVPNIGQSPGVMRPVMTSPHRHDAGSSMSASSPIEPPSYSAYFPVR